MLQADGRVEAVSVTTDLASPAVRPVAGRAVRTATFVSWSGVLFVLGVEALTSGGWDDRAWGVLAVGLLCGLPHGAVDHLVPGWWLGRRAPHVLGLVVAYAAVVAATYGVFVAFPTVALGAFVVLSAWHFGTGDLGFDDLRSGRPRRRRLLATSAHAVVVLALPVVVHPRDVEPLISAITSGWTLPGRARAALAVIAVVVVVGAGVVGLLERRLLATAELVLLVVLVVTVHPLVAFGAYFGAWHSVRHLARVVVDDPGNHGALSRGSLARPLLAFSRAAALPTAVSLALVVTLWVVADGWRDFTLTYVALLAGLTVPHMLVVAWADKRRGTAAEPRAAGR